MIQAGRKGHSNIFAIATAVQLWTLEQQPALSWHGKADGQTDYSAFFKKKKKVRKSNTCQGQICDKQK